MAQNGNLALNQTGYAITEFEMNGKMALVHREQVEQEAPAFSLAGEQSQKRIQTYNAVKYGIPIYGFGRKRIVADATGQIDPKDFLRAYNVDRGISIWPNCFTLGLLQQASTETDLEVVRGSCDFAGEANILVDTSETYSSGANGVRSSQYTGGSTTWENGGTLPKQTVTNEAVGFDMQAPGEAIIALTGGLIGDGADSVRHINIYSSTDGASWTLRPRYDLLTNVPTANEDIDGGLVAPSKIAGETIVALWDEDAKVVNLYSATTNLASWSAEIATIPAPTGVKGIAVMAGTDGNDKLYIGVESGIYEVDTSPSTWTYSKVHTPPFHDSDNYRRMTVHQFRGREAIWFGLSGLNSQAASVGVLYVNGDSYGRETDVTQEGIFLGPAAGDGCEAKFYGAFRWWKSSGQFLFAAVGGGAAGRQGWIYKFNGYGWSPFYLHGTANKKLYWLDISDKDDGTPRLHFAIRTGTSTSDAHFLELPLTNPTDGQTYTFQPDLAIDRPDYDLGLPRITKALLQINGNYINLGEKDSNENYINVDYWNGPGMLDGDLANGGDFDEDTQSITLASGAGITGQVFAFRENLKRHTSTTTTSPQGRELECNFFAKIPAVQRFTFMIDLEDSGELTGRNLKEIHANLFLARDSNTLIQLQYAEMATTYVDIKQLRFYDSYDAEGSDSADTATPRGGQCLVVCEEVIA